MVSSGLKMVGALLMLMLVGSPEPASDDSEAGEVLELAPREADDVAPEHGEAEASEAADAAPGEASSPEPPPPQLVAPTSARIPRVKRCLAQTEPCYRTTSSRLLLFGIGAATTATSVALVFSSGDRNRTGDPALSLAGGGVIAMGAALLGGAANLLGGDGPTLYDRITVPTVGLSLALGGSSVSDEKLPYGLSAGFAPTWSFPRDLGRLRLLASVGGDLGSQLERDPRESVANDDGTFATALEAKGWHGTGGLDLALCLPYPLVARRPAWLGQLEFRYKPLAFFARDRLSLGGEPRVSQRVMLTPLNFGLRWHISPRQRLTFYMGPRWDLIGYGEPKLVIPGAPVLGPIYSETWFDLDIPMRTLARARRTTVVGQFTLGYVHSRFWGNGLDFGSIVGFLGYVVSQLSIRVRPLGSSIAYQFELGANVGQGIAPFVRAGVVLPDIGGKT